jgi:hypothetical protein
VGSNPAQGTFQLRTITGASAPTLAPARAPYQQLYTRRRENYHEAAADKADRA